MFGWTKKKNKWKSPDQKFCIDDLDNKLTNDTTPNVDENDKHQDHPVDNQNDNNDTTQQNTKIILCKKSVQVKLNPV